MLKKEAKLEKKIFDADCPKAATREGFGEGLLAAARENPNVVALSADLSESVKMEAFAKEFPERYFECGVAEQGMATVAAGLAVAGKIPFAASYAAFSPGRNWEQIRTTAAYNNANVKIAGHHAGLMTGPDGATHQMLEDVAMMRAMPNMSVVVPCDAEEAKKATLAAARMFGPAYLRFAREKSPSLTTADTPFSPGKAETFWESKKPEVAILACGTMVHAALVAAKTLEEEGVGSIVLNCHTVKPLDEKRIAEVAKKTGAVVTAEDHQIAGGLGGAVAECLARKCPAIMEFVGVHDAFGESGKPEELYVKYGLSPKHVALAAKRAIARKKGE